MMIFTFRFVLFLFIQFYIAKGLRSPLDNLDFKDASLVEEYDLELSDYISEVLENFKEQMPIGIPEIGIPILDALFISNVGKTIDDDTAQVELMMRNISISGLSRFRIDELKADLEKGLLNVSLYLPQLNVSGHCFMDGRIFKIFPIRSDGPFHIKVDQVTIEGHGDLNVSIDNHQTRLHMNALKLNLDFGPLDIEFESLMEGDGFAQVLLRVLSDIGPSVFLRFRTKVMEKLDQALLNLVNRELDKGTLNDILEQIPIGRSSLHKIFVK